MGHMYEPIGTHWIVLYVNNNITNFENFGVEHFQKEIK